MRSRSLQGRSSVVGYGLGSIYVIVLQDYSLQGSSSSGSSSEIENRVIITCPTLLFWHLHGHAVLLLVISPNVHFPVEFFHVVGYNMSH